jgi:hypothetical protein
MFQPYDSFQCLQQPNGNQFGLGIFSQPTSNYHYRFGVVVQLYRTPRHFGGIAYLRKEKGRLGAYARKTHYGRGKLRNAEWSQLLDSFQKMESGLIFQFDE